MSNVRRNVAGALVSPNGIRLNSNSPECVVNAVLSISSDNTGICQKPLVASSVVNTFASPSESFYSSILGMG